ncbi:hypothetical protein BBP40_002661 [Aspergillus hancockii]|nr:hypothetical protein BBP40_002661 [Aspergillus hancockii]
MQYLTQDAITAVGFGKATGYWEANRDLFGILETIKSLHLPVHMVTLIPGLRGVLETRVAKVFLPKPNNRHGVGRFLGYVKKLVDKRYDNLESHCLDILQSFIISGLSRFQVESEALVALFGSTETTSTGLLNIIFYLPTAPRAYRALHAEIDVAARTVTKPVIGDAQTKALPYL